MADEHASTSSGSQQAVQDQNPGQGKFGIQKVYVKDLSFETPNSPQIFGQDIQPAVNLQLSSQSRHLAENSHEVVLRLTVTVAAGEQTVYLAEVSQAGIFHISGFPDEVFERMIGITCPNILFPFARELVSDLVSRGGFPQLLLAPVNFEAMYAQQQKQRQNPSADGQPKVAH